MTFFLCSLIFPSECDFSFVLPHLEYCSLVLNGLQVKNNKVENFYDHFLEDMAKQYFKSSYFMIRTFSFVFQ